MENAEHLKAGGEGAPFAVYVKAAVPVILLFIVPILIPTIALPACSVQEKEESKKEEEKKSSLPAFAQEALEMAREAQKQQRDMAKRQQQMIDEMERGYTAGPEASEQTAQWRADRDAITELIKKNAEKSSSGDFDGYLADFDAGSPIFKVDRDRLRESMEAAQIKVEIVSVTVQQLTQSEATARVARRDSVGGGVKTNTYIYTLRKAGASWKILSMQPV